MTGLLKTISMTMAIAVVIFFALLCSIDKELAREDYNNCRVAEGCIFSTFCDYYNNLEYEKRCNND